MWLLGQLNAAGGMRISEIYESIQGESTYAGHPCTFVRLTGCNMRCSWCDTAYAFYGGSEKSVEEVLTAVEGYGHRLVEVTGGEPLIQEEVFPLMSALCDEGHTVLLETGGSIDTSEVDPRVIKIVDFKPPASFMTKRNCWANVERLNGHDEVKFVIGDREDYEWSAAKVAEHGPVERATVNFSPVHGRLDPQDLVAWILEDGLEVRINLQTHKYIWGEDAVGV